QLPVHLLRGSRILDVNRPEEDVFGVALRHAAEFRQGHQADQFEKLALMLDAGITEIVVGHLVILPGELHHIFERRFLLALSSGQASGVSARQVAKGGIYLLQGNGLAGTGPDLLKSALLQCAVLVIAAQGSESEVAVPGVVAPQQAKIVDRRRFLREIAAPHGAGLVRRLLSLLTGVDPMLGYRDLREFLGGLTV